MIKESNSITEEKQSKADKKPLVGQSLAVFNKDNEENSNILRPTKLEDYIGQNRLIRQLELIIKSSKMREVIPEHILFYGQPGLGKTTLANLISNELNIDIKIVSAPSLQKSGDLVGLLVNLDKPTVVFVDEIHRLRTQVEETLYTAMEDKKVDLIMGKGTGATTARIDLEPFMLIGATTQVGKLTKPLRDRFPSVMKLEPYTLDEMLKLVERTSEILKLKLDQGAKLVVCRRSRSVPRIANNILKRFMDLQIVKKIKKLTEQDTLDFLEELGIYELGLTKTDLHFLNALLDGSLGIKTLSGILMEEAETLELVTEPYLINLGFVDKSSSGRSLTPKGRNFITKHFKN